jgi:hypothetical protein
MEAPEIVRWQCLEFAKELGCKPTLLRRFVAQRTGIVPEGDSVLWAQVTSAIKSCQWFHVYDIIEDIHRWLEKDDEQNLRVTGLGDDPLAHRYTEALNELFLTHNIGWQLVNGKVIVRGDEAFERTIKVAEQELSNRQTTQKRIEEAINGLSRKPEPDLTGAISHAFAAMECIIGDIQYTPEEVRENKRHTFGSFLSRHADLFPSEDFKEGFQCLWRYANNEGSRHGKEGMEPARNEAELIVSLAASLVTYLNRKHPK